MNLEQKMKRAADGAWREPTHYKLDGTDNEAFEELLDQGDVTIHDGFETIAEDLFELNHPEKKGDLKEQQKYIEKLGELGLSYGEWVHFPWQRNVVRYPERDDHIQLRTYRNQYLITGEEQEKLNNTTIAVFGMSVGSNITDQLVQSGIGNKYVLGDFDTLAPSNLNRIRANMGQVGLRKVDIMARKISEVDPYIEQVHVHEGYDPDTTPEILDEHRPDIIVEEIDDVMTKARIRQYAKEQGIPLVMAADLAEMSLLHVERHDLDDVMPFNGKLTKEEFDALLDGDLTDEQKLKMNIKILGARNALANARFIESNLDIGKRLAGIPQLGAIATAGAALTDRGVREILLDRKLKSGVYKQSAEKTLGTQRTSTRREHVKSVKKLVGSMRSKKTK